MERWTIKCDAHGCAAAVSAQGDSDDIAIRHVIELARSSGWLVAAFHIAQHDLCPNHRSKR